MLDFLRILTLTAFFAFATTGFASTEASLWEYWNNSDEAHSNDVDHHLWTELLTKYVITNHPSGINRFRYGDVTSVDSEKLDAYVKSLAVIDPRQLSKKVQKAYWINLYNALTVQLILKNYPISSIQDITAKGIKNTGPGEIRVVKITGKWLTLDDIENRILRPIWQDHKIHFALSCASLGCPDIQPVAFTADNSPSLLTQAGKDFIGHDRGVHFQGGKMTISKIFDWYRDDFAKDDKTLKKLLAHYAIDKQALYLLGYRGAIKYSYDGALNAP